MLRDEEGQKSETRLANERPHSIRAFKESEAPTAPDIADSLQEIGSDGPQSYASRFLTLRVRELHEEERNDGKGSCDQIQRENPLNTHNG